MIFLNLPYLDKLTDYLLLLSITFFVLVLVFVLGLYRGSK
jgi:hypothetical protein